MISSPLVTGQLSPRTNLPTCFNNSSIFIMYNHIQEVKHTHSSSDNTHKWWYDSNAHSSHYHDQEHRSQLPMLQHPLSLTRRGLWWTSHLGSRLLQALVHQEPWGTQALASSWKGDCIMAAPHCQRRWGMGYGSIWDHLSHTSRHRGTTLKFRFYARF